MTIKGLLLSGLALAMLPTSALFADTFNFSFTGNSSVTGIPGVPFSGVGQFDAQAKRRSGEPVPWRSRAGSADRVRLCGGAGFTGADHTYQHHARGFSGSGAGVTRAARHGRPGRGWCTSPQIDRLGLAGPATTPLSSMPRSSHSVTPR